jgi:hypothetical protein
MEVVVRGEVPKHRLTLDIRVIAKKEVVCLLALGVEEGVVVISLEALDHVARMTLPVVELAICCHCVDEVRSSVLHSNSVSVIICTENCQSKFRFLLMTTSCDLSSFPTVKAYRYVLRSC